MVLHDNLVEIIFRVITKPIFQDGFMSIFINSFNWFSREIGIFLYFTQIDFQSGNNCGGLQFKAVGVMKHPKHSWCALELTFW